MLDYTIEDTQRILKSFNSSELRLDSHVLDNWFERDINFDYIFECLNDKMLLSISKTMENRFKLIYLKNARIPRLLKSRMNRKFGYTVVNTF